MANSNAKGQSGQASYVDRIRKDVNEQLKKDLGGYKPKPKDGKGSSYSKGSSILEKFFTPRKDKEIFRILPPKSGSKPILEAYFHEMEVNAGTGGKKRKGVKIYCPAHNNPKVEKKDKEGNVVLDENSNPVMVPSPCPICNMYKKELKKQDNSIRGKKKEEMSEEEIEIFDRNREIFKEANKYQARKFYILRGVDKGSLKDGVKFWRFKHNFKNQGVLDKLLPILTEYLEIYNAPYYDPEEGTDLSISMVDDSFGTITYRAVAAISHRGPSKLHGDKQLVKEWLDDSITWRDVFKPKSAPNITPYQYLKLVLKGDDPFYDQDEKKWYFPNNPELEEKANQKDRDLDAETEKDIPMASDLDPSGTSIDTTSVYDKFVGSASDDVEDTNSDTDEEDEDNTPDPEPVEDKPKKGKEKVKKPEPEEEEEDDDDPYEEDDDDELPF